MFVMLKKGWGFLVIELDYTYSAVKVDDLKKYESDILRIVSNFDSKKCEGSEYLGWYNYPLHIIDGLEKLQKVAFQIKKSSQVFVVCGIGGSYLGSRAVIEAIKGFYRTDVEIVYLGNTLDERYIKDAIDYLKDRDFSINVISKSGATLETALAFRLLKELLVKKYGEKYKDRIYVTTDEKNGCLRKFSDENNLQSFVIPSDIGGRYSVFTPVGLLPLAVAGVNIKEFVLGAIASYNDFQQKDISKNLAYQYAAYRYNQYVEGGKSIELFATYSPYLNMISEWWKQLFGESEGKLNKGLYPASVNFSTDLHSLGQFVQQGSKCLFVTQIKVVDEGKLFVSKDEEDFDGLNYVSEISFSDINMIAQSGTNKAHFEYGNVDTLGVAMRGTSEKSVGYLLHFMMCSCMISAYLLGVNPFDQPGVEFYKKEMKKILKSFQKSVD